MIAWSFGGGVQSAAIAVLVREGTLPAPDLAAIADTGRERRTTWEYLRDVMTPYLAGAGVAVEVIPHALARVDLYAAGGLPLVPAYTRSVRLEDTLWGPDEVASEGRLPGYCSGEWKRDAFERWLRSRGVKECVCWVGYSADEAGRVKADHRPWCRYDHPLIRLGLDRRACETLIGAAGLPVPRKSRCWCCPHQNEAEWADVLADPVDGPLAVAVDREVREADPEGTGLYLHYGRVPLDQVRPGEGVAPPMRPCEGGHCWT